MKALALTKEIALDKTLKSLITELEEECLHVVSLI